MIKVLHIIQGYGGGVSSIVKNLIVHSDPELIKQDVMSFSYNNADAFINDLHAHGSNTYIMPRPRIDGYNRFRKTVKDIMIREQYDVIHCHTDGWRAIIYYALAKECKVPLFAIHAHRTANDPGRLSQNSLYIKLNQYISRNLADIQFACGLDAASFIYGSNQKAVIIPNGLDVSKCRQAWNSTCELRRLEFGCNNDSLLLLNVGRLVTQKNQEFLIDIAEKLYNRNISFKLIIVGDGELKDHLQEMIIHRGLEAFVSLVGRRNDVYELMYAADYLLLPSLYEGLPTVVIEAQAMGLYCLVSDHVTSECDLNLSLVDFLPIEKPDIWSERIINSSPISTSLDNIIYHLEKYSYTADSSFEKYYNELLSNVTSIEEYK